MRLFRRSASIGFLLLLAMGVLASASSILPVRAAGAIYINADGSISPSTAPISTVDNVTYVLIGNISSVADGIIINRTNVILDGSGYTLEGNGGGYGISTTLAQNLAGVAVENLDVQNFSTGIYMVGNTLSSITISKNNITGGLSFWQCSADIVENNITGGLFFYYGTANIVDNDITGSIAGMAHFSLSGNKINGSIYVSCPMHGMGAGGFDISGNKVTGSVTAGGDNAGSIDGNNINGQIYIGMIFGAEISGNNIGGGILVNSLTAPPTYISIVGNNITTNNCGSGISINGPMSGAQIYGNNIRENKVGISVSGEQFLAPVIYHNNMINNTLQVNANNIKLVLDDGYPSGGNCWSDYKSRDLNHGPYQNITGSDGIGDTPYIINVNNTDHFPLAKPYEGPYDVGITGLVPSKRIVGQGCSLTIYTSVLNYGNSTEVLNVTIYLNGNSIATFSNSAVSSRTSTTLGFSFWNTTGIPYGNYTLKATASPVPGEKDTSDNTIINGTLTITILGDVNGDGKVNVLDLILIATHLGILPNSLQWNANLDLNNDGAINVLDLILCATHMGQHW